MSLVIPTCPTGCEFDPPVVNFDYCAPVTAFGEITHIFLRSVDAGGLTDWEDAGEWLALIDNTGVVGGEIRQFTVIGSKAEPESTEIELSLNRKVHPPKKHTLSLKIDEVSDENHASLRSLECGGTYLLWYATAEYMWGGSDGINAQIVFNEVIPESSDELYHFIGTASWESKFHPERIANPLT